MIFSIYFISLRHDVWNVWDMLMLRFLFWTVFEPHPNKPPPTTISRCPLSRCDIRSASTRSTYIVRTATKSMCGGTPYFGIPSTSSIGIIHFPYTPMCSGKFIPAGLTQISNMRWKRLAKTLLMCIRNLTTSNGIDFSWADLCLRSIY